MPITPRKVELHLTPSGRVCSIKLDGEEVKNCRNVSVSSGIDQPTTVTFEIINVDVTVSADVFPEDILILRHKADW